MMEGSGGEGTMETRPRQLADVLRTPSWWERVLAHSEERLPDDAEGAGMEWLAPKRERLAAFRDLLESGEMLTVAEAVARQEYQPSLPTQLLISKGRTGRKRVIYVFPPRDDLLFKAVNRYLQEATADAVSPLCHSFQPGRGARTAFHALCLDRSLDTKYCIRLDVADYFNSIDAGKLMDSLPDVLTADAPLMHLLTAVLCRAEVIRAGQVIACPQRGVMAGSALSCLLSNLYLKDLDDHFQAAGLTYARYSDDIVLFAGQGQVLEQECFIREHLAAKGLRVNESKSQVAPPGAPWEYLGLRYQRGVVDLCDTAQYKYKAWVRRLARSYKSRPTHAASATAGEFVRQLNRRCYGVGADRSQFGWALWFFPVLTSAATLQALDQFTQATIRFAATGTRSGRGHERLPYARLRSLGYIPLAMAYYTFKRSPQVYRAMLNRRARPMRGDFDHPVDPADDE